MPDDQRPPLDPGIAHGLSRRGFVGTASAAAGGVAAGYTLAAGPVMAQTIVTTDTNGLTAGEVGIAVAGGTMPAYRAKPATGTGQPVVVVCQEIFGLHEYIRDLCRRLAKAGYVAVAPDYYFRIGDASKAADVAGAAAIANRKPDPELMADLDATFAWAAAEGGSADRIGITGFCRGGRNVWVYAAHNPRLKAGVAWYGPVAGQPSEQMPKTPLDLIAEIRCPVLGLYGAADTGIPVDSVRRMESGLAGAGKPAQFVIYPDAPHGFHADYRPSYRAEAAQDGWRRMLEFFKANGVG